MKETYELIPTDEPSEVIVPAPAPAPAAASASDDTANSTPNNAYPTTRRFTSEILELPDQLASVSVVREYILTVLHLKYAIPREEADAVAAKWDGALGGRFRKQSKAELLATFGEEYGEMLHEYRTEVFWEHMREYGRIAMIPVGSVGFLLALIGFMWVLFWCIGV